MYKRNKMNKKLRRKAPFGAFFKRRQLVITNH
ncbi:hypothetical protein SAMN04489757_11272 [Anaerocolumna aminovalerica]|uniref:Uncharacterized protein n=1 Tax=Anaerocolumna aminovalerica TaxID=1527 RepID=A0A1I5F7V4_9FIRM|nr:hypothetical protein SAMN04489757_11272 [Anaerocolumna aminovalerica]